MKRNIPRLVISGVSSNVGKTTFISALAALFKERGLKVRCFKCGPDYLDPTYHKRNSGVESISLDSWMMGTKGVEEAFLRGADGFDLCLIEGVMGLFDGANPDNEEGSTAQIAKILKAPTVLLVDASGMARSFSALVNGFVDFDKELILKGVIANRIGSESHLELLKQTGPKAEILGGILKGEICHAFPSRHLGLVSARDNLVSDESFEYWKRHVAFHLDLEKILDLARSAVPLFDKSQTKEKQVVKKCRIAYAYDDAFHFYYQENLNLLIQEGAELVPFSPLSDNFIPENIDALYLGGGYPEVYAEKLSSNREMINSIKFAAQRGMPIYGECGGLIYMSSELHLAEKKYPLLGLIEGNIVLADKLQALGYVEVETNRRSILGPAGLRFRGHQFRYSFNECTEGNQKIFRLKKRRGKKTEEEGFNSDANILATYVHAHWSSNTNIPRYFVESALHYNEMRENYV